MDRSRRLTFKIKAIKAEYLLYLLIWGLLIVRDYIGIRIPFYTFSGVILFFAFFLPRKAIVHIAVFLIPLSNAMNFRPILGMLALIYLIKKQIAKRRYFTYTYSGVILLAIMLFELFHLVVEPFSLSVYISYFCVYMFVFVVLCDADRRWCDRDTVMIFVFGVIVSNLLILGLMLIKSSMSFMSYISSLSRLGRVDAESFTSNYYLKNNPNAIANQAVVAISCLFALYSDRQEKSKVFLLICLTFLIAIGAMTVSRMFIVALCTIILWYMISANRGNRSRIAAVLIFLAFVLLVIYCAFPNVIDSYISRFTNSKTPETKTRLSIIKYYVKYMGDNFARSLFGIGMQDQEVKANYVVVSHNMILDVYVSWGLIGLILAMMFLVCVIKEYSQKSKSKMQYIAILSVLVTTQSGRLFRSVEAMVMLIIAVAIMQCTYAQENRAYDEHLQNRADDKQ